MHTDEDLILVSAAAILAGFGAAMAATETNDGPDSAQEQAALATAEAIAIAEKAVAETRAAAVSRTKMARRSSTTSLSNRQTRRGRCSDMQTDRVVSITAEDDRTEKDVADRILGKWVDGPVLAGPLARGAHQQVQRRRS
jgi:hypothetical protein